jgi:hypothetical protein
VTLEDSILWFAVLGAEAVAIAFLFYRRIFRAMPVFGFFLVWAVVSDLAMMAVARSYPQQSPQYIQIYTLEMSVDSLVQFGVLVDLAWSVLRPIRNVLPRRTIVVIALLFLLAGAVLWPIAGWVIRAGLSPQWRTLMQIQTAVSILRVLFVLVLAAFSQLLAIGWRNRELQVASGLGFYSLMGLGASILHSHPTPPAQYHTVDQVLAFSYLCSVLYWIFSFAQQEAPRHEFTPRMESFLLAVSGAARSDRMALEQLRKSSK